MTNFDFSCEMTSSKDKIWKTLLDEIEFPQKYNPTIQSAKIIERFNNGVLRVIEIPDATIRERVEFDFEKGEIITKLIDHPEVSGRISKKITPIESSGAFLVKCEIQWHAISTSIDEMIQKNVETFVSKSLQNVKQSVEG